MKKIMFNDRFCLTQAVLEGRKTMTRRIITLKQEKWLRFIEGDNPIDWIRRIKYIPKEVVSVAQSYKNAGYASDTIQRGRAVRKSIHSEDWDDEMIGKFGDWYIDQLAGWNNKMFTLPEMMPHQILITDIHVDRLQDISDEDCLNEGISRCCEYYECSRGGYIYDTQLWEPEVCPCFGTPQEAFASLIDKVTGKGTWDRNPYVFVYDFELVK